MTELVTITAEDRKEITGPASAIVAAARAFKVTNAVTYEDAADQLKRVKGAQKALEEKKRTLLNPVNATLKAIRALFAGPEMELETAEGLYKRSMLGWSDEQDRLRRAEQQKADEAAERERRRLAKEALEAEERAAAARAAGDIKKAEKLEAKADNRTDAAAAVVPAVIQREPPRVGGITERENWSALVTDFPQLVLGAAKGIMIANQGRYQGVEKLVFEKFVDSIQPVPISAVEPNMKVLNAQAKSLKRDLNWPGVRAVVDKIMAAGSR